MGSSVNMTKLSSYSNSVTREKQAATLPMCYPLSRFRITHNLIASYSRSSLSARLGFITLLGRRQRKQNPVKSNQILYGYWWSSFFTLCKSLTRLCMSLYQGILNTEFSSPLLAKQSSTDGSNDLHSLPLQTHSHRLGKSYLVALSPFHIRDVHHGSSVTIHIQSN